MNSWREGYLLEIFDGQVVLQAIVTGPPQLERAACSFAESLKFEGTAPLLDAAPRKMPGKDPFRVRLGPGPPLSFRALSFSRFLWMPSSSWRSSPSWRR